MLNSIFVLMLTGEADSGAGYVGLFVILFVGFLLYSIASNAIRKKQISCNKCKTKFNLANDVSWEEVNDDNDGTRILSEVEFDCTCSNCGETKNFSKKFEVARVVQTGGSVHPREKIVRKNINSLVRNYFR